MLDKFFNWKSGDRRMAIKFDNESEFDEFKKMALDRGCYGFCVERLSFIKNDCVANGYCGEKPKYLIHSSHGYYLGMKGCDVVNYKDIVKKSLSFGTEKELLEYCKNNRIVIKITGEIEKSMLVEMFNRNYDGDLRELAHFPHDGEYKQIYVRLFNIFEDDLDDIVGWGSEFAVYERRNCNCVELEEMYGWLQ